MKVRKVYSAFFIILIAGYVWIYLNKVDPHFGITCIFKYTTGIPCPSCGTTRAVMSILDGNILGPIQFNPLGYFYIIALLVLPFWLLLDFFTERNTLINFYAICINKLSKRKIAVPFFSLIIINWAWNIYKML
jgi:hypothetical protein